MTTYPGQVPSKLRQAIADHHAKYPPQPRAAAEIRPGELVVAGAPGVARVVLIDAVIDNDPSANGRRWASVMVCSNLIEMATDLDLILRRPGTYDLVVFAELYAQVWCDQIGEHVGTVTPEQLGAIRRSLSSDGQSIGLLGWETGLPLAGRLDPRRKFREDELVGAVMPLRDDCLNTLWGTR